jgi:hypothetical protein
MAFDDFLDNFKDCKKDRSPVSLPAAERGKRYFLYLYEIHIYHATQRKIVVEDGNFRKPVPPGASTTPTREALERYSRPID